MGLNVASVGTAVGRSVGVAVGAFVGGRRTHIPSVHSSPSPQSRSTGTAFTSQVLLRVQRLHLSAFGNNGPPQSMSVSFPFFTPSLHCFDVGDFVGARVGSLVGTSVGLSVGTPVGSEEGAGVG